MFVERMVAWCGSRQDEAVCAKDFQILYHCAVTCPKERLPWCSSHLLNLLVTFFPAGGSAR